MFQRTLFNNNHLNKYCINKYNNYIPYILDAILEKDGIK